MATLNRALGRPQQGLPQQQQAPTPQQMDPVQMLMDEYTRLEKQSTPRSMYTPEQVQQRQSQNEDLTALGMAGQLSNDQRLQQVGGGVLKNAMAARAPRVSAEGELDPLTGQMTPNPAYQEKLNEGRRAKILTQAMAMQERRDRAAENMAFRKQLADQNEQLRRDVAASKGAAGSGGAPSYNMQRVLDETTGQYIWVNPRTMETLGTVKTPEGDPMVKPDKMTTEDEKAMGQTVRMGSSVSSAIEAVRANPDAFGIGKGLVQQMPGTVGAVGQALRDRKMSPEALAARALVYNDVSKIITERAGLAQSGAELKRLNSFLPADLDGAPQIAAKLGAFQQYLAEQDTAIRGRYANRQRPTRLLEQSTPPNEQQAPPNGPAKRLRFNPQTGRLE